MKKLLLILLLSTLTFATQYKFSNKSLQSLELYGMSEQIVYQTKDERNEQISKLWTKFLGFKFLDLKNSRDQKLYVIYSNYQSNAFDCFIGIQSTKELKRLSKREIKAGEYAHTILDYQAGMDMEKVWDGIAKVELGRDFKTDIEVYNIKALQKSQYFIELYLSKK